MLYIDTSALVRRYLPDAKALAVLEAMAADSVWVTSALTRTETQLVLHRAATGQSHLEDLWNVFRHDWERMYVIPVDDRCLADAVERGAKYGLNLPDSIHLAAAQRLGTEANVLSLRLLPARFVS